jgi:hypothetical protein
MRTQKPKSSLRLNISRGVMIAYRAVICNKPLYFFAGFLQLAGGIDLSLMFKLQPNEIC